MTSGSLPFLHGDRSVVRVLLERRAAGTTPGARLDDHRVALVIGGGGMRGSYVAGMLHALERAGLRSAFDEVYGSSSGAMSGAAFLTGEGAALAACYPEDLCTRAFIDMRRLRTSRPVVNLSLLLDDVLGDRKPLAWEELGRTPAALRLVATDTADLTAHTLTGMESVADWRVALQASASIPLLAGPPVSWDGRRWVDGSVGEPLAIERALRGGATHVLVMLCRGAADLHHDAEAGLSLWARTLDRLVPGLGTVAQGSRRYGLDLRLVVAGSALGGHLCAIAPARTAKVGSLTVERGPISEAVRIGDESATAALDAVAAELDPA